MFLSFMLVLAIFSRETGKTMLWGIDFDLIAYPFYILLFISLVVLNKNFLDKNLSFLFIFLLVSGIISKAILNLSFLLLFKQFFPIVIIYSCCYYVIKKVGIKSIFELYVKFAFIAAIIGLVQFVLKLFGILILTDYATLFVDSVAEEPSHYAAIILPAVVYTLHSYKRFRLYFGTIFLSLVLTFNLTAYAVFGIMLLIVFRQIYLLIVLVPLVSFVGIYLFNNNQEMFFRINSFFVYLEDPSLKGLHGTPLSFLANYQVAKYAVASNPLFGCGLGGHEEMYYRYFANNPFANLDYLFGMNAKSAHSLLIRVLSETGIIGFLLYIYTLLRVLWIKRSSSYYGIGLACLSHFLCKALKLGNYFDLGTPFFFLIALYSYNNFKNERFEK